MKNTIAILALVVACSVLTACDERVHQTDSGGVTLVASVEGDFPYRFSVNSSDRLILEGIQITSIIANTTQASSELMTVEIDTMEVTYSRADGGSLVPPPLVRNILAKVGPGGVADLSLTVATTEQLRSPPLSDLLFENGGFDKETGKTNIKLNVHLRFFGTTLGGQDVQSEPRSLTIEFTQ